MKFKEIFKKPIFLNLMLDCQKALSIMRFSYKNVNLRKYTYFRYKNGLELLKMTHSVAVIFYNSLNATFSIDILCEYIHNTKD